ncbi:hypothetical protein FA13DRAFT_1735106 [Coprinellus micaceus]|uniref:Uncharacterized protein n=1 Tax=Coprinellus micaceus TaxID=71717 RepID=A0A4Y7T4N5_COPMI|nr:hypothetical protein FA13DRAFT_1735106 [Coprinellus micaceus]
MEPNFAVKWASPLNKTDKKKVLEYLQKMPDTASPLSPLKVGGNPWHGDTKSSTQTETGKFKTWTTKGSVSPTQYTTQVKFNKAALLEHLSGVDPFDRDIVYKQMLDFVIADLAKA